MASRAVNYWRSMTRQTGALRSITSNSSATTPKMKSMAQAAAAAANISEKAATSSMRNIISKGEFIPLYMILGFVLAAVSIAAHTAKQQLMHSPGVKVSKKKRESLPEVEDPDVIIGNSSKFVGKSFLRKVAHLQDFDSVRSGITDPTHPNPFKHSSTVETLKSVGVNPKRN